MPLQYLTWDGFCPVCGSGDISMIARTHFNEHWECQCHEYWMVPIEESVRASIEAGTRCFIDNLVASISGGLQGSGGKMR